MDDLALSTSIGSRSLLLLLPQTNVSVYISLHNVNRAVLIPFYIYSEKTPPMDFLFNLTNELVSRNVRNTIRLKESKISGGKILEEGLTSLSNSSELNSLKYRQLLYKRGYLFSQKEIEPPIPSWIKKAVGDYYIYFDTDNQWGFAQEGNSLVALLGRVTDILHWSLDINFIARTCLDKMLLTEETMLDYIDYLSGRFILIYRQSNSTKFMTDAFGTRSAFYSLQNPVMVASHYKIISDYLKSSECIRMELIKRDSRWLIPLARAYPGNLTPSEGVYILTPNTMINIEESRIKRFYPRKELPAGNLSDVVEEVSIILKRQLELLCSAYKLAISLSAGIDTRITLSAARDIVRDVLFFTYGDRRFIDNPVTYKPNKRARQRRSLETDILVADEIAKALALHHIRLDYSTLRQENFQHFNQILDCNTYHSHGRRLAKAYLDQLPPNVLHIRTNLGAMCKAGYQKQGFKELPITAEIMAQAWKRMGDNELVVRVFHEFEEVTEFANILNYDPYDMFKWEHRCGTWLTHVLLESDVAFDTFELLNCRALMEKVLSVPVDYRIKSAIHLEIIRRLWPLLALWPINNPPFSLQSENLKIERKKLKAALTLKNALIKNNKLNNQLRNISLQLKSLKIERKKLEAALKSEQPTLYKLTHRLQLIRRHVSSFLSARLHIGL